MHVSDHAHCTFLPSGRPIVDFIGTTETLDEDWATIVGEVNRRAGTAFDASAGLSNPNGHGSKAQGGVENVCDDPRIQKCAHSAAAAECPGRVLHRWQVARLKRTRRVPLTPFALHNRTTLAQLAAARRVYEQVL